MSKTRASCFITGSKYLETVSVFGTRDKALALVFDILLENVVYSHDGIVFKTEL